jgi:hypothetical protein
MKQMKTITQNFVLIAAFLIAATSCKKTPVTEIGTPGNQPPVQPIPVQLEKDGDFINVNYNTDGNIQSIVTSESTGAILANYVFTYENNKIKEINFGGKWTYTYTGNNLTRVESFNAGGQLRHTYDFTYAGNKVIEAIEYLSVVAMSPQFKSTYTYRSDGNVERKELFQYVNGQWLASEEVVYNQYDLYTNVSDQFESYPYLPANMFSPNNPVRETWYAGGTVDQTVEHIYTYDVKGRPKTKKSTFKFPGFPDSFSETKIFY